MPRGGFETGCASEVAGDKGGTMDRDKYMQQMVPVYVASLITGAGNTMTEDDRRGVVATATQLAELSYDATYPAQRARF